MPDLHPATDCHRPDCHEHVDPVPRENPPPANDVRCEIR